MNKEEILKVVEDLSRDKGFTSEDLERMAPVVDFIRGMEESSNGVDRAEYDDLKSRYDALEERYRTRFWTSPISDGEDIVERQKEDIKVDKEDNKTIEDLLRAPETSRNE